MKYNTGHPRATPNFRNLVIRPMWMTLKTALRTVPFLGRLNFLRNSYHGEYEKMVDSTTMQRVGEDHPSVGQKFAADRETSQIMPFLERPVTVMYPYERLEDLEPWLFVPGNYNGRIGVIWETCTACKACVRACPNDCRTVRRVRRTGHRGGGRGRKQCAVRRLAAGCEANPLRTLRVRARRAAVRA